MITLHLEAESPALLKQDIMDMFDLVEREESRQVLGAPKARITTDDLRAQLAAEDAEQAAEAPAPKKTRAKKGDTAAAKQAIVGEAPTDPAPAPAYLEAEPTEEPPKEMSLEDMRAVAQKLVEAKGMSAVAAVLALYKAADGQTVAKMSQVQPSQRADVAAKFEAALNAK